MILNIIFLSSCNNNIDRKNFLIYKTVLQENENTTIKSIPHNIGFVDDEIIAFQNGNQKIICFNKNGRFVNEFLLDFDFKNYIKEKIEKDSIRIFFDFDMSDNNYYKNHPWYAINNVICNNNCIYVSTYVSNPSILNEEIQLDYIQIIFKVNFKGQIINYFEVNINPIDNIWLISRAGFFVDNRENLFSFGEYNSKHIYNSIPVYQLFASKHGSDSFFFHNIPWPEKILFQDSLEKQKYTDKMKRVLIRCQFEQINNDIYFLNTEKIFNLAEKEVYYEIKDNDNDSIRAIKSFCFITSDEIETEIKLAYVEEARSKQKTGAKNYYFVVVNLTNKNLILKKHISKKPSGLCCKNNVVYYLDEDDEKISLVSIIIN